MTCSGQTSVQHILMLQVPNHAVRAQASVVVGVVRGHFELVIAMKKRGPPKGFLILLVVAERRQAAQSHPEWVFAQQVTGACHGDTRRQHPPLPRHRARARPLSHPETRLGKASLHLGQAPAVPPAACADGTLTGRRRDRRVGDGNDDGSNAPTGRPGTCPSWIDDRDGLGEC